MSGRAGRRGIDDRGIVILMIDEQMSPAVGKELIKGKADPINSAFYLTYNMVLNLLRVEDVNPEYMLQHSFYQFQHYSEIPKYLEQIKSLTEEQNKIVISNEKKVRDYFNIKNQIQILSKEFTEYIRRPEHLMPFINSGRLIKVVSDKGSDLGWATILDFKKLKKRSAEVKIDDELHTYSIDILINLDRRAFNERNQWVKPKSDENGEMKVVSIGLDNIVQISSVRMHIPADLKSYDSRQSIKKSLKVVKNKFEDKIPLLDPIEDMKIKNKDFLAIITKLETYEKRLLEIGEIDKESFDLYKKKDKLEEKIKNLRTELRKAESLLHMDELKCRKRVLRRLGYCTNSGINLKFSNLKLFINFKIP